MSGFQLNGCGARDYFTKVKYLGEHQCPNCKRIAPFYLEKGKFKISVMWIPTVTLKERYAVMCEKCEQGKWIEDAMAYKLLNGEAYRPNDSAKTAVSQEAPKCIKCGAETDGAFCGKCGTEVSPSPGPEDDSVKICSSCGTVVDGKFCRECGAEYIKEVKETTENYICTKCGTEVHGKFCTECGTERKAEVSAHVCKKCGALVEGRFCGICGTEYVDTPKYNFCEKCGAKIAANSKICSECENKTQGKTDEVVNTGTVSEEWECYLCGTKNPNTANTCSLCGCEKK